MFNPIMGKYIDWQKITDEYSTNHTYDNNESKDIIIEEWDKELKE